MNISAEEKNRYLREAEVVLAREGFQADRTHAGSLRVLFDGAPLCEVPESGGVTYRMADVSTPERIAAKDKVYSIVRAVAEYMYQMEQAPILKVDGLKDSYKLLADFNGVVLAGCPSKYGTQFVTWDRDFDHKGVSHGHYYNKAAAWRNLLRQESAAIAEAMRIHPNDFRWYAAYHDEGHHPHVHMMVWSAEPEKGYLTREGIATMRSRMTNAIFHEEMKELYIKKDAAYKESIQTAKESLLLYIRMLENSESADPVIEQKLWELSHALEQVDGKHVYAYLPKEVKTQVDEIMERLAQLPEVAACYDQWWRLKDEIAGYYGRNTPPHQPLVQQKEFRTIKNFIIREAETLREPTPVQASADAEQDKPQESSTETLTAVQQPQPAPLQNALTADAVMQLLHHMSRMFRSNMPVIPLVLRIDSKRRRRLQEKRMAMGHKRDDHEDEQLYHVNDNTMQ